MKKLIASIVAVALTLTMAPINLIAAGRLQAGAISGVATVDGKPLANVTVRLRNVDTGQLVGNMQANAQGQFSFTGLGPGNFVVETVSANGTIIGTSTAVSLTAAAMVATNVAVGTSASALAAAGGVGGATVGATTGGAVAGTAGAGSGAFITSTAGLLTLAGAGAITAGAIVISKDDASGSQ
jgi:hypothetical protein